MSVANIAYGVLLAACCTLQALLIRKEQKRIRDHEPLVFE